VVYLVSEFNPTPTSRKFDKVEPDCKLSGKSDVILTVHRRYYVEINAN